ncbi:hypothetical protein TNIN_119231 [Trichonephila inaurata madagascariensis]|uniref:Uncharacterized protein n=1 Tax=Trichonephila inaurata madagascariensis TaxID=2747483 RepID=A0A8X6X933_9ARAC|nr:hypothetical protein TNIN_119231 [Trichonephila inaurata madagascariensis]
MQKQSLANDFHFLILQTKSKSVDVSSIRSTQTLRSSTRTANASKQSCFGNPSQLSSNYRASDSCSPYQGYLDRADSNSSLPLANYGIDLDMANLPTDMELEQVMMQRNSSRPPSPQLSTCEQLKYNKAQLAKMETTRRCQQTCVDSLQQMPDHYPEEPFYTRALTELHEIEVTWP